MDYENDLNEIVAITSDTEEPSPNSEKPIIQFFKRLIENNKKDDIVLTDGQIIEILDKEFDIRLSKLHELEGIIYLAVVKKYLKDWPQWDELETIISKINKNKTKHDKQDESADIEKMLESKYVNLKSFLKSMLDNAKHMSRSTVQPFIDGQIDVAKSSDKSTRGSNIMLEIHASRNQLNQLVFRQPHPNLNNTVFNPNFELPKQIKLSTFSIEAILNWWGVSINIMTTKNIHIYKRETKHELKHVLVNKKLKKHRNSFQLLDQDIKISSISSTQTIQINDLIDRFDAIEPSTNNYEIYNFIKKDLTTLPSNIPSRKQLKRYTNKYSYVRYLYKEVDTELPTDVSNKYDLQLEETVSPCYQIYLSHIKDPSKCLYVCCLPCEIKFTGENIFSDLKSHFDAEHINEPDWTCTNCHGVFPMMELAKNWWCHRC
ncbi:uncharacterized protein LOC123668402 [Melitaea cinxia]|uniref:uncharacterized protein LOC123668402 n=1 Tax=Melitaea cinxia TaxID=113334 RepID=UPI001E271882|nr:uncharacterized protein LOC123668402 [Melitaea cinxia]XP_045458090.1 uncharacterized protein LOC123668402 [Melitaea cinxia]XP_045458092.1 uncharacterized protein LOC123668402 [Melitaea cinxia]